MNIVTGYTGTAHITSEDEALLYQFLSGKVITENTAVAIDHSETLTANDFTISGSFLLNGRLGRAETPETFDFTAVAIGYYRKDVLIIDYIKASDNTESMSFRYIEGTAATSLNDAAVPTPSTPSGSFVDWQYGVAAVITHEPNIKDIEVNEALNSVDIKSLCYLYRENAATSKNGSLIEYRLPIKSNLFLAFGQISLTGIESGVKYQLRVPANLAIGTGAVSLPTSPTSSQHLDYSNISFESNSLRFDFSHSTGSSKTVAISYIQLKYC